jgi:hypothetical protein
MKAILTRGLAAAVVISVLRVYGTNCWIQYSSTCTPNGAQVGNKSYPGCQGVAPYTTAKWAVGNWTDNGFYCWGVGQGSHYLLPADRICSGTAKSWNYCTASWDYYPDSTKYSSFDGEHSCPNP